jgi:glycosyltransferase involved in cell wall biosynthesis
MKILQFCYSKNRGGAAKAASRMHYALRKHGIDSGLITCLKSKPEEKDMICYCNSLLKQAWRKLIKVFNLLLVKYLQKTNNQDLHTFDINSVIKPRYINNSDADIVHLHWISYSMIGIKAISKIKKPIVWTFHDMWPFMGCEHYDNLSCPDRYVTGYLKHNKNVKGIDLNRIAWKIKMKYWKNLDFQIVVPSNWLKNCVKKSALLKNFNVEVIPYIIEEDKYYNISKAEARQNLSLSLEKKYILFGAFNPKNINKGGDLLHKAIEKLNADNVEILIFGSDKGPQIHGIKTTYMGFIRNESILNNLYNAADLMVVPSRQDNLPNTVLEAICCGTPVVGFNIGGLPDMIEHKKNGYLAQAFDIEDLRAGIEFILKNEDKIDFMKNCRTHFENNFSEKVVIPKMVNFYKTICKD